MANYSRLKDDIASVIRTNGNNEITGELLQSALFQIVNELGAGADFAGIATKLTVPETERTVFYFANPEESGLYNNFDVTVNENTITVISNLTGVYIANEILDFGDYRHDIDSIFDILGMGDEIEKEIIPYSKDGDLTTINTNQWFYLNQTSLVGKTITKVKANFAEAGTFTVLFGKYMNTSNYVEVARQTFTVQTGVQTVVLTNPFIFGADNCIGFNDFTNTAKFHVTRDNVNAIGGGWIGRSNVGGWTSRTDIGNLCVGVYTGGATAGSNFVKVDDLENDYTDSTKTAPTSKLLKSLYTKLYGGDNQVADMVNVIPFSTNTDTTSNPPGANEGLWFYQNQTALRGVNIEFIKANFEVGGRFSILVGKNVGTTSFTYRIAQTLNVTKGINEILINPLMLTSNEWLGFGAPNDVAQFLFSKERTNTVGAGFYSGSNSKLFEYDLNIGVFAETSSEEIVIIPYTGLTNRESSQPSGQWYYENYAVMFGKLISKVKVNVSVAGTLSILIGKNIGTSNYTFTKKTFNVVIGVNELPINTQLGNDEAIGFMDYTDTAKFYFGGNNAGDNINPIGGGMRTRQQNGGWTTVATAYDLCFGIYGGGTILDGDINKLSARVSELELNQVDPDFSVLLRGKKFSVLGDSISTFNGKIPTGHPAAYPNFGLSDWQQTWWGLLTTEKYGMELVANASWSGGTMTGTGNGSLPNYIPLLGDNPDYIFLFGGTNDYGQKRTIGDTNFYNALDRNIFAQSLCYTFEQLRLKFPNAKIIFMTSMQRDYAAQSNGKFPNKITDATPFQYEYNDKAKEICKIYGITVVDTYNCGINFWNALTYMPDKLHPNPAGMAIITDFLYKNLLK